MPKIRKPWVSWEEFEQIVGGTWTPSAHTHVMADVTNLAFPDITGFGDYLDQAVKQASSPTFVTAKLSALTDGYVPYHVSDAAGLANSPIFIDGTKVGIGMSPDADLTVSEAATNTEIQTWYADGVKVGQFKTTGSGDALFYLYHVDTSVKVCLNADGVSYFLGGNVGIGTDSPDRLLEVSAAALAYLRVTESTTPVNFEINADTNRAYIGTFTNHDLYLFTNDAVKMVIKADGSIGMGTVNPSGRLHLAETTHGSNIWQTWTAENDAGQVQTFYFVFDPDTPTFKFYGDVADTFVLNWSTGNVGIGMIPVNKLDVAGFFGLVGDDKYMVFKTGTDSAVEGYIGARDALIGPGDDGLVVRSEAALYLTAEGGGIDVTVTGGKVGIGTPSPGDYNPQADNLVIYEATYAGITLATGTGGWGQIFFADGTAGTAEYEGAIGYSHTDNEMVFYTNHTLAMTLDNVGAMTVVGSVTAPEFLGNLHWDYITNEPVAYPPLPHLHVGKAIVSLYMIDLNDERDPPGDPLDILSVGNINGQGDYDWCNAWVTAHGGSNCTALIAVGGEGGGNYLRLTDSANINSWAHAYVETEAGHPLISGLMSVRLRQSVTNRKSIMYFNADAAPRMRIIFDADGDIKFWDGAGTTVLQAYAANTWYPIRIHWDLVGGFAVVFVDNVYKTRKAIAAPDWINRIGFITDTATESFTFDVDTLFVYNITI